METYRADVLDEWFIQVSYGDWYLDRSGNIHKATVTMGGIEIEMHDPGDKIFKGKYGARLFVGDCDPILVRRLTDSKEEAIALVKEDILARPKSFGGYIDADNIDQLKVVDMVKECVVV